jgi:hypothetical protein
MTALQANPCDYMRAVRCVLYRLTATYSLTESEKPMFYDFDPYITADTDLSEADVFANFDPAAGTGTLLATALAHEAEVYAADPTGGALGRYA